MRTCPKCGKEFTLSERLCPHDGSILEDTRSAEERFLGAILAGKYRIDGFLKRGGMGAVYRGVHLMLDKTVAIKLIKPELVTSEDTVRRFQREARAASQLSHPHIVTIHDLGQAEDGTLYIAMELVEGESLKELIKREGALAPERAVRLAKGIASALALAHRSGVVHRDLKPQNVMICRDSEGGEMPKLLDFGIAKTFEAEATALTSTGMVLGTPHYMSPEQAKGMAVDARSDLYSLGIILYEMLVGKVPFHDSSVPSILIKHVNEPPRRPSEIRPGLPAGVEALVLRCLEKDPERRFASAEELARSLDSALSEVPRAPSLPPVPPAGASGDVPTTSATLGPTATATEIAAPPPPPPPVTAGNPALSSRAATVEVTTRGVTAVPQRPPRSSRKGLFVGLALAAFLFLIAGGSLLAYLVFRGFSSLGSESGDPPAAAAAASLEAFPPGDVPVEEASPPQPDTDSGDASTPGEPKAPSGEVPPPSPPESVPATAPSAPAAQKREAAAPVDPSSASKAPPAPPAAPQASPPQPEPPPAPAAAPTLPERPAVHAQCEGVGDACAALRSALADALEKTGLRQAPAASADVLVQLYAEEIESRSEQQFGTTFVVRTYSLEASAEAPRLGETVRMPPPDVFSFDTRFGRDRLSERARATAGAVAEAVQEYWSKKKALSR